MKLFNVCANKLSLSHSSLSVHGHEVANCAYCSCCDQWFHDKLGVYNYVTKAALQLPRCRVGLQSWPECEEEWPESVKKSSAILIAYLAQLNSSSDKPVVQFKGIYVF